MHMPDAPFLFLSLRVHFCLTFVDYPGLKPRTFCLSASSCFLMHFFTIHSYLSIHPYPLITVYFSFCNVCSSPHGYFLFFYIFRFSQHIPLRRPPGVCVSSRVYRSFPSLSLLSLPLSSLLLSLPLFSPGRTGDCRQLCSPLYRISIILFSRCSLL